MDEKAEDIQNIGSIEIDGKIFCISWDLLDWEKSNTDYFSMLFYLLEQGVKLIENEGLRRAQVNIHKKHITNHILDSYSADRIAEELCKFFREDARVNNDLIELLKAHVIDMREHFKKDMYDKYVIRIQETDKLFTTDYRREKTRGVQ